MTSSRTYIGFGIAGAILTCMYFEYIMLLYVILNLAIVYDTWYMTYRLNVDLVIDVNFFVLMTIFNYYLLMTYQQNPLFLLKIAFITQLSDVYQFIAGSLFGNNKIGWISKNKSYEGYIGGYILTILTFVPIQVLFDRQCTSIQMCFNNCSMIYLLGVIGGLISSFVKRSINIKDYSNLLGDHGGWVDRIDSIILPILMLK